MFGIEKIDGIHTIFTLSFENPSKSLIMQELLESININPLAIDTSAIANWPMTYFSAKIQNFTTRKVAVSYILRQYPNNPYNLKNLYGGKEIIEVKPNYLNSMHTLDPVSYTHLDVYKRQGKSNDIALERRDKDVFV